MYHMAILPYAKAAAHLYGIYHVQDLIEMIKQYEAVEYRRKDMQKELLEVLREEDYLQYAGAYVLDVRFFPNTDAAICFYKKNKQKPWFYPSMETLGNYVNRDYIEIRKEHQALAQFMKAHSQASEQEISKTMRKVLRKIQGDCDMRHIMEDFLILGKIEDAQMPLFAKLLEDLMNHTRRFANHGYTPNELRMLMLEKQ